MVENTDVMKLSNELTYQRYLFNREHIKDIFMKMSIQEYIALHHSGLEAETEHHYYG